MYCPHPAVATRPPYCLSTPALTVTDASPRGEFKRGSQTVGSELVRDSVSKPQSLHSTVSVVERSISTEISPVTRFRGSILRG